MADQYGNTVDGEVWVPTHNHTQRGIRPSGQCPACDQYNSTGIWFPVPTAEATPARTSVNYRKMGRGG